VPLFAYTPREAADWPRLVPAPVAALSLPRERSYGAPSGALPRTPNPRSPWLAASPAAVVAQESPQPADVSAILFRPRPASPSPLAVVASAERATARPLSCALATTFTLGDDSPTATPAARGPASTARTAAAASSAFSFGFTGMFDKPALPMGPPQITASAPPAAAESAKWVEQKPSPRQVAAALPVQPAASTGPAADGSTAPTAAALPPVLCVLCGGDKHQLPRCIKTGRRHVVAAPPSKPARPPLRL
jgi:hypothetical protein